jgi:predicted HTH domain antitoxin
MSNAVLINIPERLKDEADMYVRGGYFDNRSELIREALREYLRGLGTKNIELAVGLYRKGDISLGKAAEVSGLGYEKMKGVLAERGIPLRRAPQTAGEADDDYAVASQLI